MSLTYIPGSLLRARLPSRCDPTTSACTTGPALDYEAEFRLYDGDSDDMGRPVAHGRMLYTIATSRADAIGQVRAYGANVGADVSRIDAWPNTGAPQPWTGSRAQLVGCE